MEGQYQYRFIGSVFIRTIFTLFLLLLEQPTGAKVNVDVLQRLPVLPRPMTISGFSTGGMMAMQMQVAFSKSFDGAAAFSSLWYRCAPYGEIFYKYHCQGGIYPVEKGIEDAAKFESQGLIDKLSFLKFQKFYHWIAAKDEDVKPSVKLANRKVVDEIFETTSQHVVDFRLQTKTFYEGVGMKPGHIFIKQEPKAYFSMPTANKSEPSCTLSVEGQAASGDSIGVSFCTYYGAFEGLRYILNDSLLSPTRNPRPIQLQPIRLFDQTVFLSKENQKFMDPVGFYYIPSRCKTAPVQAPPCRVHMVLHDCLGGRSNIMSQFVKRSGYLEVAEVNNIIMIFPQSIAFAGNKDGCWDTFGASDQETYATKNGVQMAALAKMLGNVTGKAF